MPPLPCHTRTLLAAVAASSHASIRPPRVYTALIAQCDSWSCSDITGNLLLILVGIGIGLLLCSFFIDGEHLPAHGSDDLLSIDEQESPSEPDGTREACGDGDVEKKGTQLACAE